MPTYAYACTECDHRFEAVQSFSDDSLTVCPECGGRLRKVFNAVGIVFKGGGFYRTDSRSDSGSSASSGKGASPKDGGSGGTSSSSEGSSSAGSASSGSSGSSSGSGTASSTGRADKPAASTSSA